MFYAASMSASNSMQSSDKEPETPIGSMFESQIPAFSTQVGLENVTVDEGERGTTQRKCRSRFTMEEDTLLIQAWLNISKDAIVGVDKKADGFWLRIKDNLSANLN